ncbi:MAG: hypothetical protein ACP5KV_00255 [Candidatus Methanomethylicaceae archaeon]
MSGVLVAFWYQIHPKPRRERPSKSNLFSLCHLYNHLRDLKIKKWRNGRASLSEEDLRPATLEMRRNDQSLKGVHS